jgi:hypothetical protein
LEFLKASIADLITLFFSSLQNSEGGGDSDSFKLFLPVFGRLLEIQQIETDAGMVCNLQ